MTTPTSNSVDDVLDNIAISMLKSGNTKIAKSKLFELVMGAMPKNKKPSDPKYHNKPHKPDENEIAEGYQTDFTPRSICYVANADDGYNQALTDMKLALEKLFNKDSPND